MDFLVLSPPVCTPAEPPSGAFLLAAGLAGRGLDVGLLDLSLELYHRILTDPEVPGPPVAAAMEYLMTADGGYEPQRHRGAIGTLHRRLKGFAELHPGWRLSLMDIRPPGRVHDPLALAEMCSSGIGPFTSLWEEVLVPALDRHRPGQVLVSLAYLSQLASAVDLVRFLGQRGITPVVGGSLPNSLARTGRGFASLEAVFPRMELGDGLSLIGSGEAGHMLDSLGWPALLSGRPYFSFRPIVPLVLSTGCFWRRCLFCPDRDLPFHAIELPALEEFLARMPDELAARRPVLHLLDSALPPSRLSLFLAIARRHELQFYGFARPTARLLRDDLLPEAAASGCLMLQLGVESGSGALLERFSKGIDPAEAEQVVRVASESGIRTYLYMLFGLPGENDGDREATLELMARNAGSVDFLNLSLFNLPLRCELGDRAAEFGIRIEQIPDDGAIRLYLPFASNGGSPRSDAKRFLDERFKPDRLIRPALLRTPRWLRAAHLALMKVGGRRGP